MNPDREIFEPGTYFGIKVTEKMLDWAIDECPRAQSLLDIAAEVRREINGGGWRGFTPSAAWRVKVKQIHEQSLYQAESQAEHRKHNYDIAVPAPFCEDCQRWHQPTLTCVDNEQIFNEGIAAVARKHAHNTPERADWMDA
jgi:hypothetical protein